MPILKWRTPEFNVVFLPFPLFRCLDAGLYDIHIRVFDRTGHRRNYDKGTTGHVRAVLQGPEEILPVLLL